MTTWTTIKERTIRHSALCATYSAVCTSAKYPGVTMSMTITNNAAGRKTEKTYSVGSASYWTLKDAVNAAR